MQEIIFGDYEMKLKINEGQKMFLLIAMIFIIMFSVIFFLPLALKSIGAEGRTIETTIIDIKYAGGGFAHPQKTILFTNNSTYIFNGLVAIDMHKLIKIEAIYYSNWFLNSNYYELISYEYIGGEK